MTVLKRFDHTRVSIVAKLTTALGADGARLLVGGFSDGPAIADVCPVFLTSEHSTRIVEKITVISQTYKTLRL